MRTVFTPSLDDVANLLLLAEDTSPEIGRMAWHLLRRDALTGLKLKELLELARDAGIRVGSQHWSLSALVINQQVDRLVTSDGRTWKDAHDLLDPGRVEGVDYRGLLRVLDARLARYSANKVRMQRLRERLIRESGMTRAT